MKAQTTNFNHGSLSPLSWDSEHFCFPVAKIVDPDLDNAELRETLTNARRKGIRLIYWPTGADRKICPSLLQEFTGTLVDRRVTFAKELRRLWVPGLPRRRPTHAFGVIDEYPKTLPTRELLDLSAAAGAYSRFAVDPRIPKEKFVQLFESWMQKSTLREIADHVLVATSLGPFPECLGVVTLSLTAGEARIGLIAVKTAVRGKGLGFALVDAAHQKAIEGAITRAVVKTQLGNIPACRLYERCGYRIAKVQNYYHFWLR